MEHRTHPAWEKIQRCGWGGGTVPVYLSGRFVPTGRSSPVVNPATGKFFAPMSMGEPGHHPFPAPRYGEYHQQVADGYKVQQQGDGHVPESVVFLKHIEREQALSAAALTTVTR